ncbi:unnamed protein product [Rotaria magnacalcarata]
MTSLAVANFCTYNVGIFLGYGNGTFTQQHILPTGNGSCPGSIALGDFNSDDFLDIAVANEITANVGMFLGYGNGHFSQQKTHSTGTGSLSQPLAVKDVSNDSRLDIVVANFGDNNVGILFGYGGGNFTDQMTFEIGSGTQPIAVVVEDFNQENRLDIFVINYQTFNVMILLRDGSQPLLSMTTYSTGNNSHPQSMIISDFNNDSKLDIIVANQGNDNIGMLLGYGDGTFMTQTTYSTKNGSKPCSLAYGDFNNDSMLDIAVANTGTNNVEIRQVRFSIAVSDFNNDNCLDIAVANLASKDVVLLFGDCKATFGKLQSCAMDYGSQLYSIAVGDFNRDSWIDIAVANYGNDEMKTLLQTCQSS